MMKQRVPLVSRLVVSLAVALAVLAIPCDVAYQQYWGSAARIPQEVTLVDIAKVRKAIEAYRHERHSLPKTLRGLPPAENEYVHVDESGVPFDWWRRPLHYWTNGNHYRVTSYGRDGKPGGVGFDCDLSSDDLGTQQTPTTSWWSLAKLPKQARPTFGQFLSDRGERNIQGSTGMILVCALGGMAAFVLSIREIGVPMSRGEAPTRRWVRLLIAIGGTLSMALVIAAVHVPSGH